jgi:hypothetical protein
MGAAAELVVRQQKKGDPMSAFLDRFQPDPEFGRRLWRAPKPLLRAAVVSVAPPYPEYPTLTVNESVGSPDDPSSPSAREVGSDIAVSLYEDSGNGSGSLQERAWEYILARHAEIEAALRRKLFAWHGKRLAQFREDNLPGAPPEYQVYWAVAEKQVAMGGPAAVDHLFKLIGIGLADSGMDECGFTSFEFQTGWDRDHGLGVLMHKDRVLAAGGLTELIRGPGVLEGAKAVQAYDLDEGDLVL